MIPGNTVKNPELEESEDATSLATVLYMGRDTHALMHRHSAAKLK